MTSATMRADIEARCKPGDLWQLGEHRLICGDSTDTTTLQRLLSEATPHMVFSDPPYGIKVVPKSGRLGKGVNYLQMIGDDTTTTAINAYRLYTSQFSQATQIWWGANYYTEALHPSRCWIIWDKENGTTSFADAELAWTNLKTSVRIFRHRWNGANRASERGQPRYHPAQKPIRLAMYYYEKYGKPDDVVLDPFVGSGITMLASALMEDRRRVYGIEISPHYCDVTIARYEALTGDTAILIERIDERQEGEA